MKHLAVGVVLALVGLRLFFAVFPTYLPSGPDLAPATAAWQGAGAPGVGFHDEEGGPVFSLASATNRSAMVEFAVASVAGIDAIGVRAQCAAEGLRQGRSRHEVGRVILAFVDAQGKSRWDWPHVAGTVKGTRGWTPVIRRFVVPADAVSARVILANQGPEGVLRVRGVSVVPMGMNPRVPFVFAAWGGLWAAGAWVAARRLRLGSRPRGRAVLAAALAVVAGMLLPERAIFAVGTGLRRVSRALHTAAVQHASPGQGTATGAAPAVAVAPQAGTKPARDAVRVRDAPPSIDLHKAGHLAVFAWLAAVSAGCFGIRLVRTAGSAAGIGALVLYAFAAEQLQWLTLTRSAQLVDIGYNLIGIAAGLLLAEAWRAFRRRSAA
jgi:hypothetical protein